MNFINEITNKDKDLFFGPIELKHAAGLFPSISQARKNGWNKPIPNGFTILTIGKKVKKKNIFILKV